MSTIASKLAREELVDMVPYQSARRLYASGIDSTSTKNKIWLNANEASGTGHYNIDSKSINRYPDFQPDNLINAYCAYSGLTPANILATRGADEYIYIYTYIYIHILPTHTCCHQNVRLCRGAQAQATICRPAALGESRNMPARANTSCTAP